MKALLILITAAAFAVIRVSNLGDCELKRTRGQLHERNSKPNKFSNRKSQTIACSISGRCRRQQRCSPDCETTSKLQTQVNACFAPPKGTVEWFYNNLFI